MNSRSTRWLAAAAIPFAAAGALALGGTAHAAPSSLSASTAISNHPDSGAGGNWAYDDFTRTLTVKADATVADCSSLAGWVTGDSCYTATVSDSGHAHAILGVLAPNQVQDPNVKISHAVTTSMQGGAPYFVFAPAADTLTGTVETSQDDNFASPLGDDTTSQWPAQAFMTPASVTVDYADGGNGWSWTYKTACESWTDAGTNGGGDLAGDGDITGKDCTPAPPTTPPTPPAGQVPVLSHGMAHSVSPTREDVSFEQTIASVDKFEIVGPGAINGHVGWVHAQAGENEAVYSGLEAGHGYTVYYQPYTSVNGSPIPGSSVGYVYFKTAS